MPPCTSEPVSRPNRADRAQILPTVPAMPPENDSDSDSPALPRRRQQGSSATVTAGQPPAAWPGRPVDGHKGTFGRVLLIGGSRGMAGSIALSSIAALHAGSGLVAAAVPDGILETVAGFSPAIMTIPLPDARGAVSAEAWSAVQPRLAQQSAIGCGPGLTTGQGTVRLVEGLLSGRPAPLVLDADALNVIAQEDWLSRSDLWHAANEGKADQPAMVWTPHPGELARLTGVSPGDVDGQLDAAGELAKQTGAVIVVKGGPTKVVSCDDRGSSATVWTNSSGNPGMATAGCGDVLTGVITSLLGQGLGAVDAARLGVWWHGVAGDRAAAATSLIGITSVDLLHHLAAVPA